MSETRVRFAPSPTGFLHVGGLRTALFNYLFAAHTQGTTILRIEDTDQNRKVEGAVENLIESLSWAGIVFDEGPHVGGAFGPYIQSERLTIYRKYAEQLIEQGSAYYCFCTEDRLKELREKQMAEKQDPRYDGSCRQLSAAEVEQKLAENIPHVVRLKIDRTKSDILVSDIVRGEVSFSTAQIDDQVLMKSDGYPTYHLANVVDDHLMQITHVIRGEEWLPSTPKHVQLYEYFGWEPPQFVHLPLLLNPDRSKLSKRQGDVATEDYRTKGFLPRALINFIALLGWNTSDNQEIFTLEELKEKFSLERVGKAGAVFDLEKLKWMNQQYIKQAPIGELTELLQPFLPKAALKEDKLHLQKIIQSVRDHLIVLLDINQKLDLFLNEDLKLTDTALLTQIKSETAQKVLRSFISLVEQLDSLSAANFGAIMKQVQKATGVKGKDLWGPMRIAITHVEHGPDLGSVVDIFGKVKCLKMVRQVLT
jgi:glutamyl-tRNA synthetase